MRVLLWLKWFPPVMRLLAAIAARRLAESEYDKVPDAEGEVARLRKHTYVAGPWARVG